MLDPNIRNFLDTVESYKIRYFLEGYVQYIHNSYSAMFDIVLSHAEIDDEYRHLIFQLALLVKTDTTIVYGDPQTNRNLMRPVNEDIGKIMFIKPHPGHLAPTFDNSEHNLSRNLSNRMASIISRSDKFTTLDNYGITCSTFIDVDAFNGQLFTEHQYLNYA